MDNNPRLRLAKAESDEPVSSPQSSPPVMNSNLPDQPSAVNTYSGSGGVFSGTFNSIEALNAALRATVPPGHTMSVATIPAQPPATNFYSRSGGFSMGSFDSIEQFDAAMRATTQPAHATSGFATQGQTDDIVSRLETECDDLKEQVADLEAQLSFVTGNLTTQLRKESDATGAEKHMLQDQIAMQSNEIEMLRDEISAKEEEIKQLSKGIRDGAPMLDLPDALAVGHEVVLRSKFINDYHLTNNVLARISRIAANVGERENLYSFLHSENRDAYYCIDEVCERGKLASQALHPGQSQCSVHGANCSFMVKVVTVGLESKLLVFNHNIPIPDTRQTEA
ncbi:hypothetical protein DER45DRAFT_624706 [Fusarium avenaceum]|nr:hypothetical protein DER45DRAFT_624706 [Fusarium avenaceum]